MSWGVYSSLFTFSMIKFMFAPFAGRGLSVSFWETFISCSAGAIFSSAIFFFSASYFMNLAAKKYQDKLRKSIVNGTIIKPKKKFTRMNKFIVRIKHSIGIIGVCFYAPLFLSIPGGSIIAAKFYGHDRRAFPLIVLGIGVNGIILTSLAYFIF